MLEKLGFRGDVYMTEPTADLTELSLLDTAKIAHEDHPERALFDSRDVTALLKRFRTFPYHQQFNIQGFAITFIDAGHIMGSASVQVEVDGKIFAFSGDLGNTPEDITMPTEYFEKADYVVMESTYGDRVHPPGQPEDIIAEEIHQVKSTGGALLIPAFSLERTQELLHILHHMNPDVPVYLDSPMAQRATAIYERYKSYMNEEMSKDFQTAHPFIFPTLHMVANRTESGEAMRSDGPKVIIAGSGMMTGGRILGHAQVMLPMDTTVLLFVGYQGPRTLGRALLSGDKQVYIGGESVHVAARIAELQTMSSHADQPKLLQWLKVIKGVDHVFLTHGDDEPRAALKEKIQKELGIAKVSLPHHNEEITLS
jgi:metallo-beta-lactamase family protein